MQVGGSRRATALLVALAVVALVGSACSSGASHPAAAPIRRATTTSTSRPTTTVSPTTAAPTTAVPTTTPPTTAAPSTTVSPRPVTTLRPASPTATCAPSGCPALPGLPPNVWYPPTIALSQPVCTFDGIGRWMLSMRLTFVTGAYGIWGVLTMNGWSGGSQPVAGYSATLNVEFVSADPSARPPPETGITFETQWGTERVAAAPVSFSCSAPPTSAP
jgi:hypothetical protein